MEIDYEKKAADFIESISSKDSTQKYFDYDDMIWMISEYMKQQDKQEHDRKKNKNIFLNGKI